MCDLTAVATVKPSSFPLLVLSISKLALFIPRIGMGVTDSLGAKLCEFKPDSICKSDIYVLIVLKAAVDFALFGKCWSDFKQRSLLLVFGTFGLLRRYFKDSSLWWIWRVRIPASLYVFVDKACKGTPKVSLHPVQSILCSFFKEYFGAEKKTSGPCVIVERVKAVD